jgi:hypothetical protein
VQLANESRGYFDAAALLNMGRTFVFSEEVPRTSQIKLSVVSKQKPLGVRSVPASAELRWTWADGRLNIVVPPIDLLTSIVIDKQPGSDDQLASRLELPVDNPLVRLAASLDTRASLGESLTTSWPVERFENGPFLWLGEGTKEGLSFDLQVFKPTPLQLTARVTPGHSRTDRLRHLSLIVDGKELWNGTVDRRDGINIPLSLPLGVHSVTLQCLDRATVKGQANGDQRNLLVALQGVQIDSSDK